jgi:hypothetical protein
VAKIFLGNIIVENPNYNQGKVTDIKFRKFFLLFISESLSSRVLSKNLKIKMYEKLFCYYMGVRFGLSHWRKAFGPGREELRETGGARTP